MGRGDRPVDATLLAKAKTSYLFFPIIEEEAGVAKPFPKKKLAMVRILAVISFLSFAFLVAAAQDQDSSANFGQTNRLKAKVGGAGGFTPAWGLFSFDAINSTLISAGMPPLSKRPMYLSGGEGYGYILLLKNVRIGGTGVTGTVSSASYTPATNTEKNVDYHVSYGGFLIDYVVPVGDRLDLSAGVTIGGGGIEYHHVERQRRSQPVEFSLVRIREQ